MLTVREALDFPALAAAAPLIRVVGEDGLRRQVRWVHSSEVLDIAPLLRGGEVLLTGGGQLLALDDAERRSYVVALASRGLAALAVETTSWEEGVIEVLAADAEFAGLTLVELRRTVRFVDVAEEINSAIVNRQARVRAIVDDLSRRIAEHISVHGPDLPEILRLAADTLQARVCLIGADGQVQQAGGGPEAAVVPRPSSGPSVSPARGLSPHLPPDPEGETVRAWGRRRGRARCTRRGSWSEAMWRLSCRSSPPSPRRT